MARTEQQLDRQQYRKTQRLIEQTHGGFHGKSLLEQITDHLDEAVGRYLDCTDEDKKKTARGEVRGLARALCTFATPMYRDVKHCERVAVRRVKEQRNAAEQSHPQEGEVSDE